MQLGVLARDLIAAQVGEALERVRVWALVVVPVWVLERLWVLARDLIAAQLAQALERVRVWALVVVPV